MAQVGCCRQPRLRTRQLQQQQQLCSWHDEHFVLGHLFLGVVGLASPVGTVLVSAHSCASQSAVPTQGWQVLNRPSPHNCHRRLSTFFDLAMPGMISAHPCHTPLCCGMAWHASAQLAHGCVPQASLCRCMWVCLRQAFAIAPMWPPKLGTVGSHCQQLAKCTCSTRAQCDCMLSSGASTGCCRLQLPRHCWQLLLLAACPRDCHGLHCKM